MSPAHALQVIVVTAAFGSVLGGISSWLEAGWARSHRFGRKATHVGVFSGAAGVQLWAGFWGVALFGTTLSILFLVARWVWPDGGPAGSLRRTPDPSRRGGGILIPWGATILGGATTTLLLGDLAVVGYLVCGWGDPLGAWVGSTVGRRRILPPFHQKGPGQKTILGTMGVFAGGCLGGSAALVSLGLPWGQAVATGVACAGAGALAEALAPSESDNFWVQLVPALTAWWLMG